jgi:hypothetical protein
MKIVDAGHEYLVPNYDGEGEQQITFLKRIGDGYPGNTGEPHPGTNCQELIRVLINRVQYLEGQIRCEDNGRIVYHLRRALLEFERRATMRHGSDEMYPLQLWDEDAPVEDMPVCELCGHLALFPHQHEEAQCQPVAEVS